MRMNRYSVLLVGFIIFSICFAGCGTGGSELPDNSTSIPEQAESTATPTPTPKPFIVKEAIKIQLALD